MYVGTSGNRLADRWRTSPAYDADTGQRLPKNQLFHSQCWRRIQEAHLRNPDRPASYTVKSITGRELQKLLRTTQLSAFGMLPEKSVVFSVEQFLCAQKSSTLSGT